jgi:hypothetical protein
MTQLQQLSEPFRGSLVKQAPQGKHGSYVAHSTVTERLLSIVGPYSLHVEQLIRGYAPEVKGKNQTWMQRTDAVVGVVATLTVTIDGREVSVSEVGTEDQPAMHTDAENAKNALSDAMKRCAMRLGLGLHLWSQNDYFLEAQLKKNAKTSRGGGEPVGGEADQDTPTQRGIDPDHSVCLCTLEEAMDGHRCHCPAHEFCGDGECDQAPTQRGLLDD